MINGEMIDFSFLTRVFVSVICGLTIGVERQIRGKPVGIRTSILICFGTMLFIYLGLNVGGENNVARVLGQTITGIGFLGAGVIMTKDDVVSGVTSAAVVWILAGIGAAIGFKFYSIALFSCVVVIGVLVGIEWLESAYKGLRKGVHNRKE